jgi:hypothetical protein
MKHGKLLRIGGYVSGGVLILSERTRPTDRLTL